MQTEQSWAKPAVYLTQGTVACHQIELALTSSLTLCLLKNVHHNEQYRTLTAVTDA